ncbi:hypothetical protein ACHAWF_013783, partial [Thalassiosira exigua]
MSAHPHFPEAFPLQAVKDAMKIIMTNNIFEFGSLHFLQLLGTAMGTSAAVMWATFYFGRHEVKKLLPDFGKYFYHRRLRRFIDDIFAIWICDTCRSACCPHFDAFTAALNDFGLLRWTVDKLSKKCTFLDLNIEIEGKRIVTSTYQKPLNLYLYLPGPSAHPEGCIKGTIFGLL